MVVLVAGMVVMWTFSVFGWLSGSALFLCLHWGGWYISSATLLENQIANFCHISLRSCKLGYNLFRNFHFLSYAVTCFVISKKELFPNWSYTYYGLAFLHLQFKFREIVSIIQVTPYICQTFQQVKGRQKVSILTMCCKYFNNGCF